MRGPQVTETETQPDAVADNPSTLGREVWASIAIGALCLAAGAAISIGTRQD